MNRQRRLVLGLGVLGAIVIVVAGAAGLSGIFGPTPSPSFAVTTPTATPSLEPGETASPTPSTEPGPSSTPSPSPTPLTVPDPLTGRPVPPEVAARHPIAVMIDDQQDARPQSGLSFASVVWQAPAEGGIPRYMAIFQDRIPAAVGPVRSARYYFISWASEWKAVYAHAGGSPQALSTLKSKGNGQWVYNADGFRYSGTFHRISTRRAPHNLYTSGAALRKLAAHLKAKDNTTTGIWQFAPDAALDARPTGGTIQVSYLANKVRYDYDRTSNTYLRTVSVEGKQKDASVGVRVAPKNVIVMLMHFGPLNDNHPEKHRLEAQLVGSGKAWIATNGHTIIGTWKKTALTGPTRFYDSKGNPVTLTIGQTFVQVMPYGSPVVVKDGKVVAPAASASSSAAPSPSAAAQADPGLAVVPADLGPEAIAAPVPDGAVELRPTIAGL